MAFEQGGNSVLTSALTGASTNASDPDATTTNSGATSDTFATTTANNSVTPPSTTSSSYQGFLTTTTFANFSTTPTESSFTDLPQSSSITASSSTESTDLSQSSSTFTSLTTTFSPITSTSASSNFPLLFSTSSGVTTVFFTPIDSSSTSSFSSVTSSSATATAIAESSSTSSSGPSSSVIGGAVGGVLGALLIACTIVYFSWRRQRALKNAETEIDFDPGWGFGSSVNGSMGGMGGRDTDVVSMSHVSNYTIEKMDNVAVRQGLNYPMANYHQNLPVDPFAHPYQQGADNWQPGSRSHMGDFGSVQGYHDGVADVITFQPAGGDYHSSGSGEKDEGLSTWGSSIRRRTSLK